MSETILIVDDERHIRDVLSIYLKKEGYHIITAENGKEGLEIARRELPSIIISDSMMPVMDGLEFCMHVKKDDALRDIIFIMLTGKNSIEDSIEGLNTGADEYLTKPFNNKEIVARIRAFSRISTLQRELKEKNDKLESLDKVKNDLTHMIVHDMKTPISGIMLTLDILLDEMFTNNLAPEQIKFLTNCRINSKELLNMVTNLLDITQMEEGRLVLDLLEFDPRTVADELVYELKQLVEDRALVVTISIPADLGMLYADRSIYKRVIMNLFTNAIKHTPKKGSIIISCQKTATSIQTTINDTGEGIPEEFKNKIFEKFSKVTTKMTQRLDTGLGLTFCKMAVAAHNGEILVDSLLGKGSSFTVSLPLNIV